jgi:hypothetical protein
MVFPSCPLVEKPLYVEVLLSKLGIYGPTLEMCCQGQQGFDCRGNE